MHAREEKDAEKMKMKEIQKKLKLQQKRKEQKESDDSNSDYSVHDEPEDEVDVDPNTCYKCGDSDDNSGWMDVNDVHRCTCSRLTQANINVTICFILGNFRSWVPQSIFI